MPQERSAITGRPPRRVPRVTAGEILSFAIRRSGLAFVVRNTAGRRKVPILVYHNPEPGVFAEHLAYLAARYRFLRLSELVAALHSRDWRCVPPRSLVVTFDDGHRGNVRLLPLFERYGLVPTLYLCTQIVGTGRRFWFLEVTDPEPFKRLADGELRAALERDVGFSPLRAYDCDRQQALQDDDVRLLRGHVEFGSHTRFHPILPRCSDEDSEAEIDGSKSEVEELVGLRCDHFSFPNGDYGERELALVKKAGYLSARTTEIGWNGVERDPFRLKVMSMPDDASVNRLAAEVSGVKSTVLAVRRAMRGKPRKF
ncbi:MAG: polysaccharide deacetylase family protein [Actinobacteria bacterium]|nr:polysaccharide deacetylase family protein [Actinomycetota bacterium]